jgi:hypothetical protein
MATKRSIDTKVHTKATISSRTTDDGQVIDLIEATPRAGFPRARTFYEERCEGKRIAFDGGGDIHQEWKIKGWL